MYRFAATACLALAMASCAPSRDLSFRFEGATPEQLSLAQEAAQEWVMACPGVHLEVSRSEGDIPISIVPEDTYPDKVNGVTHHLDYGVTFYVAWMHVEAPAANLRAVYAHEMGHAMGLKHSNHGVMRIDAPFDTHVEPGDCP